MWMKRTIAALLLFVVLTASAFDAFAASWYTVPSGYTVDKMTKAEKSVYKKMVAAKKKTLPEGKKWTNSTKYSSLITEDYFPIPFPMNGSGCLAFALKLSDIGFGINGSNASSKPLKPIRKKLKKVTIRVGDILRINNDTHSVVVVAVLSDKTGKKTRKAYVLAEGNYNGRIHWGRVLTRSEINDGLTEIWTRW